MLTTVILVMGSHTQAGEVRYFPQVHSLKDQREITSDALHSQLNLIEYVETLSRVTPVILMVEILGSDFAFGDASMCPSHLSNISPVDTNYSERELRHNFQDELNFLREYGGALYLLCTRKIEKAYAGGSITLSEFEQQRIDQAYAQFNADLQSGRVADRPDRRGLLRWYLKNNFPDVFLRVFQERENFAARRAIEFARANPYAVVIIVFGRDHDFADEFKNVYDVKYSEIRVP